MAATAFRDARTGEPRRGFTLIELLVVVTVVSTILSATVVLMHFVLEMDTEVRQRTHTVATVGRLAEQFRRDVHQARGEPLVAADHRAAEFHLSGGRIVKWRIDEPSGVIRTEQASDGAGHGVGILPAIREDSFSLPQGTTAALESQPQGLSHDRNDPHRFAGHGRAFAGDRSAGIPRSATGRRGGEAMKRETLSGKLSSPSGRGSGGDGLLGQARFCHRSLGVNSPHRSRLPEGEGERRRGAALVVVLIGMAVAMAIFFSVLKMIAVQRQSVELQTRQIQAGWLAESAVERACAGFPPKPTTAAKPGAFPRQTSADATVRRSRSASTTSPASPIAARSASRPITRTILTNGPGRAAK